jgi:hypothetical protein
MIKFTFFCVFLRVLAGSKKGLEKCVFLSKFVEISCFRARFLGRFSGFPGSSGGRQNRAKSSKMAKIGVLGMDWT